jgi:hypothetical protein
MVMRGILAEHPRARLWLLVVVFVLFAGIASTWVYLVNLRSPFNQAVYDRIQLGMTVEEATKIVGMPPGYYKVSREERFVNSGQEGIEPFGTKDYEEIETEPGIFDIVSKKTGVPVASLRIWKNQDDGIFVVIQEDKVVSKYYVRSITAFDRSLWWTNLRRRLGL